ncbi:MAG: amidohydrolase family protein [Xanthomonadales bacterium]|nr:amidohydrolase family protein [Xanthomonadales bacterium]
MKTTRLGIILVVSVFLAACSDSTPPPPPPPENTLADKVSVDSLPLKESFSILLAGTLVGKLEVEHNAGITLVDFEFRNNGRGPSIKEKLKRAENGLPSSWTIEGSTAFGNKVDEHFILTGSQASWKDTTGSSSTTLAEPQMYVSQEASPYAIWVYAQALLADDDHSMPVLPGGTLRMDSMQQLSLKGEAAEISATVYAMSGLGLNPTYFLLDDNSALLAIISPSFALIREGFEAEDERLRALATEFSAQRFELIQKNVAHNFDGPIRIKNVRIFDPATQQLGEPVSVIVSGNKIEKITPVDSPALAGETVIDGAGGSLVAGMYEMHGHVSQNGGLLNIAAGVTSVRDMGNNNEVLSGLIDKMKSGRLAGPRITRSGFIEGKSPYSSNNGIVASTEEEALAAVRQYAGGEYYQIKIYNSMNPQWVPAMIAEAHALGLKVAGHVPAFSNADAMIAAGYDELTHINQVMLGWVLDEGEDTRTLLRLTALRRLPALEMDDPKIAATINAMVEKNVSIDPTLAIHEALLRSRNGAVSPGSVDFIEHMPVGIQRSAKTAWADIATPEDDKAYWQAFDKIIETVKLMRDKGIMLLPGTDLGGSFYYHRELELYQLIGMTPAEILKWATYDMAAYLGQEDMLGSIEAGKYADFFLIPGDPTKDLKAIKTISMVVKDGTVYFPSEIYPEFGIRPFVTAPSVQQLEVKEVL